MKMSIIALFVTNKKVGIFLGEGFVLNQIVLSVRKWLRKNNYEDVADLIDEIMEEWNKSGKKTRRDWWEVLSGDKQGNSRVIYGRTIPVLKAAQLRQGVPVTNNAICRNIYEQPPCIRKTNRWTNGGYRN